MPKYLIYGSYNKTRFYFLGEIVTEKIKEVEKMARQFANSYPYQAYSRIGASMVVI
jgi:hypothetical protein